MSLANTGYNFLYFSVVMYWLIQIELQYKTSYLHGFNPKHALVAISNY